MEIMKDYRNGSFLMTQEEIIAEQASWDDGDSCKAFDFTSDPFWMVSDDGIDPIPFSTMAEADAYIASLGE